MQLRIAWALACAVPLSATACSSDSAEPFESVRSEADSTVHAPTLAWRGDVTFSGAEREAISRGATWLEGRTGVGHTITWDAPHVDDRYECRPRTIARRPALSGGYYITKPDCINIGVAVDYPLDAIAAHEFMHSLGPLTHDKNASLMRPSDPLLKWSDADQSYCESAGICAAR